MSGFIEGEFVSYREGNCRAQVDCFHNCHPRGEFFVREIVEGIAVNTGCSCVVANFSREEIDLNREICAENEGGILEYREVLRENFERFGGPYLVIVIHGMRNREGKDIEIGTRGGKLGSSDVLEWFVERVCDKFSDFRVKVDEEFCGNKILEDHREALGEEVNIFQVELSRDLREEFLSEIIDGFGEIVLDFSDRF